MRLLIAQAPEGSARLFGLDGYTFAEILDLENPTLGEVWTIDDMQRGQYGEGDKILIDPELIQEGHPQSAVFLSFLKSLEFEDSGERVGTEKLAMFWRPIKTP